MTRTSSLEEEGTAKENVRPILEEELVDVDGEKAPGSVSWNEYSLLSSSDGDDSRGLGKNVNDFVDAFEIEEIKAKDEPLPGMLISFTELLSPNALDMRLSNEIFIGPYRVGIKIRQQLLPLDPDSNFTEEFLEAFTLYNHFEYLSVQVDFNGEQVLKYMRPQYEELEPDVVKIDFNDEELANFLLPVLESIAEVSGSFFEEEFVVPDDSFHCFLEEVFEEVLSSPEPAVPPPSKSKCKKTRSHTDACPGQRSRPLQKKKSSSKNKAPNPKTCKDKSRPQADYSRRRTGPTTRSQTKARAGPFTRSQAKSKKGTFYCITIYNH